MKCKKTKLFLGSLAPVVIFPTILSLSATGEAAANGNNPSDPNAPSEPTLDPKFDTFGDEVNKITKSKLSTLIDDKILEFRRKSQDLVKTSAASSNDIIKGIYLQKVADYLENNRDKILENPTEYGLNIVYPKIISLNKDLYTTTVIYEGNEYTNIKFGLTASYPSDEIIPSATEDKSLNTTDLSTLREKTYTYYDNLTSEFEDVFANAKDIPTLASKESGNDNNRDITKISYDSDHNGINISLPEGYKSWDEYIRSKVVKRFTAFDLLQNSSDEEEKQDDPYPPITDEEKPNDPLEESELRFVPQLPPILKYEFFDLYKDKIQNESKYQELVSESSKDINRFNNSFYFDNPIFTRYEYKIESLAIENITENSVSKAVLVANVKIIDSLNVGNTRIYKTTFEMPADKETSLSREAARNLIAATYKRFYDALGIGERIQIKRLGNKSLVTTVYNMIVASNNLIKPSEANDKFETKYFDLIKKYKYLQYNLVGENRKNILPEGEYRTELLNLFLGSLDRLTFSVNKSELNNNQSATGYGYFEYLVVTYKKLALKLKEIMDETRMSIVKSNFKAFNLDLNVLEQGFKTLNDDLDLISGVVNSSSFSIEKKFDHYVNILDQLQKTLVNLSILTTKESLDPEQTKSDGDNPSKKFVKAYNELNETKAIAKETKKTATSQVIGGIFSFIGLISLISWAILKLSKNKKMKLSRKNSIILLSVSTLTFILGITLIILSLIGGIL